MSAQISELDAALAPWAEWLIAVAAYNGLQARITSTRRSLAEQTRLYNRMISGARRYPVAPPGHSAHQYGLAFDLIVFPELWLEPLGSLWESVGGIWGGRFSDPVHFEHPAWPHLHAEIRRQQTGRL